MTSRNLVAVAKISAKKGLGQMLIKEVLGRGANSGEQVCAKFYPTLCFFGCFTLIIALFMLILAISLLLLAPSGALIAIPIY